jgi:DNA-binding response OmpR family regulator
MSLHGWAELGEVLILAREEVVAALLGLMVEVSGFQPKFAGKDEPVKRALGEKRLHAVLIDCDHPEFSEELIAAIRNSETRVILFSPFRMDAEVSRLAARYKAKSFTLPAEPNALSSLLSD